ncbi:MAG: nitronate monooxygenase [Candidatus Rokubacteria bacterium]|nr:nitronate monooxygenase [Candidatus Rokubacteria bacterium]MBI2156133.1 nitronate monooxygenase [Candidatus Rokubacteria bacterium]
MTTKTRSPLHTPLCDLLGIRYPICQAGMGWVARSALAAAVSAAGGLGVIAAVHGTPAELRDEIRRVRDATDRPFGVDVLFATIRAAGAEVERFTDQVKGWTDVALEERVPVLIAGLGNPGPVTAEAHRLGIKVMALCGNVKQARDHAQNGVDVVIAQGHEAGGHTGRIGGLVLIPAVVDAVAPTPVVAAGGLADGRGLAAALALGAVGVWMGTRFIATGEAWGHDNYKKKVVAIDEEGTVVHRGATGKPCRAVRNNFTREWEKRVGEILPFPLQAQRVGFPAALLARERGDVENGHAACGQSAGLVRDIVPAREVIERVVAEAEAVLARLGGRGSGAA